MAHKKEKTMESKRFAYYIISGEGEVGTWERTRPLTATGIKRRLTKERCGGDRWAMAYLPAYKDCQGNLIGYDVDGGPSRIVLSGCR